MPPNVTMAPRGILHEHEYEIAPTILPPTENKAAPRKIRLVWINIILVGLMHVISIYGFYLMFASARIYTSIYTIIMYHLGVMGILTGAHRLWTHRSYTAKWPLRLFLTFCNTLAFENSVIEWARDHRQHHKYSDTDADPHNSKRGFFFSHFGWLLCRKHPEVIKQGKKIDLSDLYADPIIAFQHKYLMILRPLICFILPVSVPVLLWNETWLNAFCINIFRYISTLHGTFLINSAGHMWGDKPYDKDINPTENVVVSVASLGEGWHNYHHTFPWDYKAAELGKYSVNFSTGFIDMAAKIGLAYNLKTVSPDMIKKRVQRTGDGTHQIWGWGDKDQPKEDLTDATIFYKQKCFCYILSMISAFGYTKFRIFVEGKRFIYYSFIAFIVLNKSY